MIELSKHTEALALRLAEAQSLSVDETIRRALEARSAVSGPSPAKRELSSDIIATRSAAIERAVRAIAVLPELDPRTSKQIMDDLDPL